MPSCQGGSASSNLAECTGGWTGRSGDEAFAPRGVECESAHGKAWESACFGSTRASVQIRLRRLCVCDCGVVQPVRRPAVNGHDAGSNPATTADWKSSGWIRSPSRKRVARGSTPALWVRVPRLPLRGVSHVRWAGRHRRQPSKLERRVQLPQRTSGWFSPWEEAGRGPRGRGPRETCPCPDGGRGGCVKELRDSRGWS